MGKRKILSCKCSNRVVFLKRDFTLGCRNDLDMFELIDILRWGRKRESEFAPWIEGTKGKSEEEEQ